MQVMAILLLLGNDSNQWMLDQLLNNHIFQVPTGEGKLIVMGVTSTVLAYLGFYVDCVCYSEHLSKRDYEELLILFRDFRVEEKIRYGTFE